MSVSAASVSVVATAGGTALVTAEGDGQSVDVKNPGPVTVYLGGSGVTVAQGYPLLAGEAKQYDLAPGDILVGIAASGTQSVNVFYLGA